MVRKACIPIPISRLCRKDEQKACAVKPPGKTFAQKDDVLFHPSICPCFACPASPLYLGSEPPAWSQGHPCPYPREAPRAFVTLQHHSVGTHSRGQGHPGTVRVSVTPEEQFSHPGVQMALSR